MKYFTFALLILLFMGCGPSRQYSPNPDPKTSLASPQDWYKDAVFYHIWVKSFNDTNNDGIGDLQGITAKLDYLKDLGISSLWLSPIFSCSLKNENMHGYDTTDFYTINPAFGTLEDLRNLLTQAHNRGIRVIFDYDVNLVSRSHPWFFDAIKNGPKRDWFIWSEKPESTWSVPWGGGGWSKVWHKSGNSYYYGVFGAHMPDLNYKNPEVVNAAADILTYWLNQGFDGARVDAARYLVEDGPGKAADTSETHEIFKKLRKEVLDVYGQKGYGKFMVGEIWADPKIIRSYYGNGSDEFQMTFDFTLPKLISTAVNDPQKANTNELQDHILSIQSALPPAGANGTFLSNHDEVAERPFTAMESDGKKAGLAFALNALLPGTPFVYYGNEMGMPSGFQTNDGRLRTAMDWNNKGAPLWNEYKALISLRNSHSSLRTGTIRFIPSVEEGVLAFIRENSQERTLVLINLKPVKAEINLQDNGTTVFKGTLEPQTWSVTTL